MSVGNGAAEPVSNRLLLAARVAHRLTQHQLAEAVGEAHWRLFTKEAAFDADHVSKLERGLITWPNARYREAFRTVLGAATDAELGFYSRRSRSTVEAGELADGSREVDAVRRNKFIRLMTGAGAGLGITGVAAALPDPVREVLSLAVEPAAPGRVGDAEVEQVREVTKTFEIWLARYGGGGCRDALAGQLRWAAGLLRGWTEGSTRRELHSAVGSLADMAAWSDVDAGRHEMAQSCFGLALYCAEVAHDWTLRAVVLTDMSQQAVSRERLDDALSLIELAQVRADRVTGTGSANMRSAQACILGRAGRVAECRSAVSAAEDLFANHQPADESTGSSLFCRANADDLALYNSNAMFCAGRHDPATALAATSQLRAALDRSDSTERPARHAMGIAKLATLELVHGDRDEGVALGHQALELGGGVRSAWVVGDLRRLRSATSRHTGPSVDALRHQLDSILLAA
ncbi:MAG: hypothetical protein ACRDTE_13010 [Pseudonocardiaceae bacterium]